MSLSEDGQAAEKEYKVGYCFFTGDIISVECRRLVFDVNICVYGHAIVQFIQVNPEIIS